MMTLIRALRALLAFQRPSIDCYNKPTRETSSFCWVTELLYSTIPCPPLQGTMERKVACREAYLLAYLVSYGR